jgi:hypothetical protein
MKKNTTERQNHHIMPFTYEDRAVRTVQINDEPWFIAKDVCDVLGVANPRETLRNFPENEKGVSTTDTLGGPQEMLVVNEPGLYRLIFQSRKPEAERFKTWVFAEVLPRIRRTGNYGNAPGGVDAGEIYSLFSGDPAMTIRRVNKLIYYIALNPPLANTDIAKLLDANESSVSYWRKWVPAETARAAVRKLGLTALGASENAPTHHGHTRKALPGLPPDCLDPLAEEAEHE